LNLGDCDCKGGYNCFEELDSDRYPFGSSAYGTPLIPFVTIASNDIPRGKAFIQRIVGWSIPGSKLKHNGCVFVDDQSWSFTNKWVDFFAYTQQGYHMLDQQHNSPNVDIQWPSQCVILDYLAKVHIDTSPLNSTCSPSMNRRDEDILDAVVPFPSLVERKAGIQVEICSTPGCDALIADTQWVALGSGISGLVSLSWFLYIVMKSKSNYYSQTSSFLPMLLFSVFIGSIVAMIYSIVVHYALNADITVVSVFGISYNGTMFV